MGGGGCGVGGCWGWDGDVVSGFTDSKTRVVVWFGFWGGAIGFGMGAAGSGLKGIVDRFTVLVSILLCQLFVCHEVESPTYRVSFLFSFL